MTRPFTVSGIDEASRTMVKQRPKAGIDVRTRHTKGGVVIAAAPSMRDQSHPWKMSFTWSKSAWLAAVKPGFVNGKEVKIGDKSIIDDPVPNLNLTGWRIDNRPPDHFKRDVQRGMDIYRTQVWLEQPRAAMGQETQVTNPTSGGGTLTIIATITGQSGPARLYAGQYQPDRDVSELEIFEGTAQESFSDTIRIADIFAVTEPGAGITQSSRIVSRNAVFWNLMHASPDLPDQQATEPFSINLPLAGGIGQAAVNASLARDNAAREKVLAYLRRFRMKGTFWSV
jgi:hypothetical protein